MRLGKKETTFQILFSEPYYNKGDELIAANGVKLKVIRTYRNTWWNRFLTWLKLSVIRKGLVKVKML